MKRLMLGIMVLSSVAIIADTDATMHIMANIVAPLRVEEIQAMNFGNMTRNEYSEADGKFKISGEAGAKVDIDFPKDVQIKHANGNSLNVNLREDHGDNKNLNTEGNFELTMKGQMYVPLDAVLGSYKGEFVARVRYR